MEEKFATVRDQVLEFHAEFQPEQTVTGGPKVPDTPMVRLRLRLVFEEAFEFLRACGAETFNVELIVNRLIDDVTAGNVAIVDVADALGDLDYVVEGSRLAYGIDGRPVAAEIHRSNLSKRGGYRREDGKWVKGPDYSPADIDGELRKQGWRP
jgi:predicted HAD superfamily Cof-like phosphohydrolase